MGNCFCCKEEINEVNEVIKPSELTTSIALKFPHGYHGVQFNEEKKEFEACDINDWIKQLYKDTKWTGWIVYNDQTEHIDGGPKDEFAALKDSPGLKDSPSGLKDSPLSPKDSPEHKDEPHRSGKRGHCKGILAWNATHLSWLVHSVPNFPREFNGQTISAIEISELLYGQSFFHIIKPAEEDFVKMVIAQIYHMEAHIYMRQNELIIPQTLNIDQIKRVIFSDKIIHVAKPPHYEIDIYSEYLNTYATDWQVETWKRGHSFPKSPHLKEIIQLCINGIEFKESQDHSKWGTSKRYFWIGDLNRMTSQAKRGGGGFLLKYHGVAETLRTCIVHAE